MDNNTIKQVLDGLTSRGVLSADGRRQMFTILLQQAKEHADETTLLKDDLKNVRAQRDGLVQKIRTLESQVAKKK